MAVAGGRQRACALGRGGSSAGGEPLLGGPKARGSRAAAAEARRATRGGRSPWRRRWGGRARDARAPLRQRPPRLPAVSAAGPGVGGRLGRPGTARAGGRALRRSRRPRADPEKQNVLERAGRRGRRAGPRCSPRSPGGRGHLYGGRRPGSPARRGLGRGRARCGTPDPQRERGAAAGTRAGGSPCLSCLVF
ncbi:uncharacterized protein C10orf95-like [Cavia porcellus]|uniref:uncharacterized protein C10orf95-like n=1 Tax=Cavia porcellus TaxID=10141 RepID=UPI002FE0E5F3